jgi:hypothetical protein
MLEIDIISMMLSQFLKKPIFVLRQLQNFYERKIRKILNYDTNYFILTNFLHYCFLYFIKL